MFTFWWVGAALSAAGAAVFVSRGLDAPAGLLAAWTAITGIIVWVHYRQECSEGDD